MGMTGKAVGLETQSLLRGRLQQCNQAMTCEATKEVMAEIE
jgi:hypothetical protein